jgi:hypothetical protein
MKEKCICWESLGKKFGIHDHALRDHPLTF